MDKQRDDGSESVTQQVQRRDIDVKKCDKFSSEYSKTPEYTAPDCTDPYLTLF